MSSSASLHILPVNRVMHIAERIEGERLYRLIAVFPQSNDAVVFGLHEGNTAPEWMPYSTISNGLLTRAISLDVEDASDKFLRPNSLLSDKEKSERDRRYEIIAPLVSGDSTLVLSDEHRGGAIARRANEAGVHRNKVYLYLSLWWRHGQIRNALVPQFSNRGLSGSRLNPSAIKRGRPRMDSNAHHDLGININAEIRQKILHGIKYVEEGRSVSQAYEEVLNHHFREKELVDGAPV